MTRPFAALLLVAVLAGPSRGFAQVSDSLPGLRSARLGRVRLGVVVPPSMTGAGRLVWPRPDPGALARAWSDSVMARLAARAGARWSAGLTGADSLLRAPAPPLDLSAAPSDISGRAPPAIVMRQYADLGLQVNARFEARFDRLRNLRCTAADATQLSAACRGGFSPPRLEPQFQVRTGGVVGDRIHLNVDYDSEREFEASNNIQVFYQGLPDEIIRRAQVGNVTFSAPNSRFITGGVPTNNFGAQIEGQLGAVEFGAIFAQQKGNVVRGRVFTIGERSVQAVDRELVDRDFEPLRFFFVIDPATLPGYPAVDILNPGALPNALQVREVRLYRRRASAARTTTEQNLTGIDAVALRPDSPQRAGPFAWELLTEGRDYYLDPSGRWFGLVGRLDQDDYLAVSYVTAAGDTVGTFPAASVAGRSDTLRLIYEPRRAADVPTFRYEIRNAYRVGGVGDVVRESMQMQVLVAESERPTSAAPTFVNLLGMALESDATTFDQYNRLFPRALDPGAGSPLRDYYVIFPHLQPFADSTRLAPEFRTDSLYRTPAYLLNSQGPTPLFQMRLHYDASGGDDRRVLSLGGFQIREGSEHISAGGTPLVRGQDYTMNYEIGQVTFLQPDSLFRRPTAVSVQYEENPAFAIAPTSIYGLQGRYDLGDHGSIGAVGLLQRERTTFTRPPLGFEPSSNFIGGITSNLRFEPQRVSRWLDALPFIQTEARSTLTLDAEIATSRPSPNQVGAAYVETFEDEAGTFLPLNEDQWEYGSRPGSAVGLAGTGIDPVLGFNDSDATVLTWQNLIPSTTGTVTFRSQDIDPSIRLQGTGETAETILWLALHPDTLGGIVDPTDLQSRWTLPHTAGPRWRSITQPVSSTGIDLTRVEYLEFWVYEDSSRQARNAGLSLALDFGTVYEDAVAFQPTGFRVSGADTTYSGRRRAGEGRLDTERDSLTNAFNARINDLGILGDVADSIRNLDVDTLVRNMPLCHSELGESFVVYNWGNVLAHCTRRNGRVDTEDLNNDQHLDTLIAVAAEDHLRYVFRVGDPRYYVRDGATTSAGATWRLYRIPFRADTVQVGQPDLRQIRAVRITAIAPDNGATERTLFLGVARMKLVGAPWVKRSGSPIAGLSGASGAPHGEVVASVVSTEDFGDLGYVSPPGVTDQGANRGGNFQVGAVQINERSLRLLGTDVRAGERVEAYRHFAEGDRNFLGYRQMRVWARGRGAGWDDRQLAFYVKVAQDENNFYLYRQSLSTTTWEPELVVDFSHWLAMRAHIEQRFLRGDPPGGAAQCGGDTLAYVECDGAYMVQVRNPGVAPPNLTRVQELAVGFLRDSGSSVDSAEVWVDDIRLTGVVDDAGYAGAVSVRLAAADVADFAATLTRRDANFRQLGDDPSYVATNQLSIGGTIRLERFGLDRFGLIAPVTMRLDRSSSDPYYLNRSDVLAAGLDGLRHPERRNTSVAISLRRSRRGTLWWQRAVTDNLSLAVLRQGSRATTELSRSRSQVINTRVDYTVQPGGLEVRYVPGFVRGLLGGLPGFLRRTDMVRGLESGRLRWTPSLIQLSSELARSSVDRIAYRAPIPTLADTLAADVRTETAVLRNRAQVDFRPFASTLVGASITEDRDLHDYGDSTTVARVTQTGRRDLLGAGIGFERSRQLSTRLTYAPPFVSWLRPRLTTSSSFNLSRDPNARIAERADGDSAGAFRLPTTFGAQRTVELAGTVDPSRPLRSIFGDSSAVRRLLDRVGLIDMSRRTDRSSQFSAAGFDPGLHYQLGLGGRGGFLAQEGRGAAAANEVVESRVSSTLRLPFAVTMTGVYADRQTTQWFQRGTGQQQVFGRDTDWPNVTGRWLWSPRGRLGRLLTSVNASVGWRERASTTIQPGLGTVAEADAADAVRTLTDSRSVPVSLTLSLASRVVASLSTSADHTRAERTGNLTLSDRGQKSANVSFAFRVPPEIIPLRSQVRTTLRYLTAVSRSCIQRAGTAECIAIADSRRDEYTLQFDTDMPPNASGGLAASYILTEDAHANRKFSQFVLTATVRITFQAGELR